jgi:hypothetical protein
MELGGSSAQAFILTDPGLSALDDLTGGRVGGARSIIKPGRPGQATCAE